MDAREGEEVCQPGALPGVCVCVFLRPCQACRGKAARGQGEARFEWGRLGTRGSASVTQCASRCVQSASFVAAAPAAVSHPLCSNFAAPEPRRHTGHARLDFSSRYHIVAGFGRSGMTLSHHKRRAPQSCSYCSYPNPCRIASDRIVPSVIPKLTTGPSWQ
ncbi:hypothetical protein L1887_54656 [Cichorium endivia]|nr:hypothetical protein L1887_54656 [Cichorium endivia]